MSVRCTSIYRLVLSNTKNFVVKNVKVAVQVAGMQVAEEKVAVAESAA